MKTIYFVGGARPNFMKLAPIFRAWRNGASTVQAKLVHTGQHYDAALSDVFFKQLELPQPDLTLEVGSGSHGAQTAAVLERFEKALVETTDEILGVVVVGDVNSTIAAALAAKKLGYPVAHVEAGLRSFDRGMPEELNRLATDAISDLLLVSEPSGITNLEKEGVSPDRIHYTGNVMIDSVAHALQSLDPKKECQALGINLDAPFLLVTMHRPSNVDTKERLSQVVNTLLNIAKKHPIVFPVHPRTQARLTEFGLSSTLESGSNITLLKPVGYNQMLSLMSLAKAVLTDSGGIQEETTYLKVPCFTLRPNTERPVTITQGTNTLLGEDLDKAYTLVMDSFSNPNLTSHPDIDGWDGKAGQRIMDKLLSAWS